MLHAKHQSPTHNCLFQTTCNSPAPTNAASPLASHGRNIQQSLVWPCQVNGAEVLVHAPYCLWQVFAFQHVCRRLLIALYHLIAADQDRPTRLCTLLYGASVSGSLSCDDLADVPPRPGIPLGRSRDYLDLRRGPLRYARTLVFTVCKRAFCNRQPQQSRKHVLHGKYPLARSSICGSIPCRTV
jgi:hypothetical protein